jgi:two-component system, NtrC family, nitrogen regulation sensor histidine kinase NtrY
MSSNNQQPDNSAKKRLAPIWLLGLIVLALLTFLILLQTSNLWKSLSVETASDTLTLYALSTLNFIAFVIFAFIFIRNIVKLARERRSFQLGAKIKTRLLIYFAAVSILPIVAMAGFSYLFMNRALERWFTKIPENVVRKAQSDQISGQREMAKMLVASLENQQLNNSILTKIAENGNLSFLEIYSVTGELSARSERQSSSKEKDELAKVLSSNAFITANFADGRKLLLISNAETSNSFEKSLIEFDLLKNGQLSIRQIGFSTLGLLTFLLIFASSWTAFYIARGITTPIKALAEGSNEIAAGNFSHRVNVLAEDELALLVESFNQMSSKLAENQGERKERRRYIETILQSLSTGVISFDATDKITLINRSAIKIFRFEDAHFEGFTLDKLLGNDNRIVLQTLINRAKRIGQSSEQTILVREHADGNAENGESLPVALTATALPNNNGVVLVIEDLTELINAQRASAWQEVARRMAHEIKNPLTPIQLSAERIAKKMQNSDEDKQIVKIVREGTETILREVSSLKTMVDEFSRFARLPKVKLESGNLTGLIRQTVDLFEDRGVKININAAENLPNILVDDEQLKRVFVNLIENAVESFDASQTDKQIVINTLHNEKRDLIIAEVADNGSGILPQNFAKLFQPYFSTKGRGTGLGLAIVQRIISEHGGKIRAVQNIPKGSKFIVELPVFNSVQTEQPNRSEAALSN